MKLKRKHNYSSFPWLEGEKVRQREQKTAVCGNKLSSSMLKIILFKRRTANKQKNKEQNMILSHYQVHASLSDAT